MKDKRGGPFALKLQNDVHDFIDCTPAVLCYTFSTFVRRDLCHTLSAKNCMKLGSL
jgi:hypothetical protein